MVGGLDHFEVVFDDEEEPPLSIRVRKAASSLLMSSKWRPVVGSSKIKSVFEPVVWRDAPRVYALRLAARKGGRRLAEPQIAEADISST